MKFLSRALPTLVTLALFILLLSLGFWQLDRAEQKQQLERQKQRDRASEESPLQLSTITLVDPEWHYRKVKISGTYDTQHQWLLDNRHYKGRVGFHVLTLLHAQGQALLVNRGWIPLGPNRNQLPVIDVSPEKTLVSGILTPVGEQQLLLGDAGYTSNQWPKIIQRLEIDQMSAQTNSIVVPAVLQLNAQNLTCYTCDWSIPQGAMTVEKHRGYAVQWFALAAALVCIYFIMLFRQFTGDKTKVVKQ